MKNMTDPLGPRESPRADHLASAASVDWRESGAVTGVKSQGKLKHFF